MADNNYLKYQQALSNAQSYYWSDTVTATWNPMTMQWEVRTKEAPPVEPTSNEWGEICP